MTELSQEYIEDCFRDVQAGKYSGELYVPVIVPSEENKDIISIPVNEGFSREVFERTDGREWKRCTFVGEKSKVTPQKYIELMNIEMGKHPLYQNGMGVELVPNSNEPTGYNVIGGANAKSVVAWAAAQLSLTHEVLV